MFSWIKRFLSTKPQHKAVYTFTGPRIKVEELESIHLQGLTDFERCVFKLQADKTDNKALEEWVYSDEQLQKLLSEDDYLGLISIDYTARSAPYEAIKILETYVEQSRYYEYKLREVLRIIVNRRGGVGEALVRCYDMYCDGYDFLSDLGLGYGLSFCCDDHGASSKDVGALYPEVMFEATKVLYWLNTKKIIISGHNGNYRGLEYQDNRTI